MRKFEDYASDEAKYAYIKEHSKVKYTITKDYNGIDYIDAIDSTNNLHIGILTKQPVNAPTLVTDTGKYIKDISTGFYLGEEDGHTFWSIIPRYGRFEYTATEVKKHNIIKLKYMNTSSSVDVIKVRDKFLYDRYLFNSIEDVLAYIFLTSKHDFGERDMAYYAGNRKYSDSLVLIR